MRARHVFFFWLPLFASWMLMAVEGPLLSSAINRLNDEVVMLAALGITFSLAITIESPILNLLATSTALVRDRGSFLLVRRFTRQSIVLVTVIAFLVGWTPLFDWVVHDLLETPDKVANGVRVGLRILVPWSACIAWRRFLQGVLIRSGATRKIVAGTVVRLVATVGTAFTLAATGRLSGIAMAAWAMLAGVSAEAFYVDRAARPVVHGLLAGGVVKGRATVSVVGAPARPALTYGALFWFHLPLTATSLLTLMTQPLVTSTLARLDHPTVNLAAWPLIFQAMMVLRSGALALPEVVIALAEEPGAARALRRFTLLLAAAGAGVMVLLVATPLADFYLIHLQDTTAEVAALASAGLVVFVPLPALATLVAWQRGLLIHQRRTRWVNEGMAIQLVTVVALLALALHWRWPGIPAAGAAIVGSWLLQVIYLGWRMGRSPLPLVDDDRPHAAVR